MYYTIVIFVPCFFMMFSIGQNEPTVKTNSGEIRGKKLNILGKPIHAYLGIPYAVPPVDDLRFRKPLPINPWQGIYNATKKSPSCPQYSPKFELDWIAKDNINEDCLYLNVWTPYTNGSLPSGKATIVWIHGGGFLHGSSVLDIYDGQLLASQGDIIVISMNYRVGAFGFLYSGTDEAPGNIGLHDQLLAIRWIRDNLRIFGGDPSLITIAGQSAGAISASFHLLSPLSRGITNRVILESGSAYNSIFALSPTVSKLATSIFAARIGCKSNLRSPKKVLLCLRNLSAEAIYNEEAKMVNETLIGFFPRYGDDFLPNHPISMTNDGNFHPADMLIGNTVDEGSLFIALRNWTLLFRDNPVTSRSNAEYYIRDLLRYNYDVPNNDVIEKYMEHVPDDGISPLKAAYRAVGAHMFVCPSIFTSEKFSVNNSVYYYHFTHRSSRPRHMLKKWMGVYHMQEIPFVFGDPLRREDEYSKEEIEFSASIMEAWSSFAKKGVPHYPPLSEEWPKFSLDNSSYVELNPYRVNISYTLRKDECDFWRPVI